MPDDLDPSPLLHHSMASQARKDNVFSLSRFLADHVVDPAIKVSDSADVYVLYMLTHLLARFHLMPKGSSAVKTTSPGLQW